MPTTMRDRLDSLSEEQRSQLQYAFENQFSQYVDIGDNQFMGVHVTPIEHLEVIESAGAWSYGRIKGSEFKGHTGESNDHQE